MHSRCGFAKTWRGVGAGGFRETSSTRTCTPAKPTGGAPRLRFRENGACGWRVRDKT
jgi:hypothetical protein